MTQRLVVFSKVPNAKFHDRTPASGRFHQLTKTKLELSDGALRAAMT